MRKILFWSFWKIFTTKCVGKFLFFPWSFLAYVYYNDLANTQTHNGLGKVIKRVPGSEFLGKRAPGSEFLGKRVPGSEFLGKRVPGSEFLGKRVPGSEFLGKRVPGSEFLGKRAPGSEFLGKRSISYDGHDEDEFEFSKRSPEISSGLSQSDRDNFFKNILIGHQLGFRQWTGKESSNFIIFLRPS